MQKKYQLTGLTIFLMLSVFTFVQCTKENFVEPDDPFEVERLDPDPEVIILGEGENALTLKTNRDNITDSDAGIRIKGGLFAENEMYGNLRITNGDFELEAAEDGNYYNNITGFALVDMPNEGILKNLIKSSISAAPIGFKKGSEFETGAFAWPVNENRYYFYYELDTPFDVQITNSSLENIKKLAIDPLDPYMFISCDFNGTAIGDLSDVGMAISAQGFIPYHRQVNYYKKVKEFNGHIFLSAALSLNKYPVTIHGETVIGFDSDDSASADKFFDGGLSSYRQGLNGKATFDHQALDWLDVEIILAEASVYFERTPDGHTYLAWAGKRDYPATSISDFMEQVIGADWDFLDYLVPLQNKEKFYGSIGSELSDYEMGFEMKSQLKFPNNTTLDVGTMKLFTSTDYMKFYGSMNVAVLGEVGIEGRVDKNGYFKFKGFHHYGRSFDWKDILEISYDFDMYLEVERDGDGISIEGEVDFEAEICLGKLCIDFSATLYARIQTDGYFKLKFEVGICGKGFDITIKYKPKSANGMSAMEIQDVLEIPIEQVPMEYRFEQNEVYEK